MGKDKIPLFWYSLNSFKRRGKRTVQSRLRSLLKKEKENYGDLLSKYIVEKVSGKQTKWYRPNSDINNSNLLAIGSILKYADTKSIIWGSGIIERTEVVSDCIIKAVRGPLTKARLMELGINCPEIYGDPAILMPRFYAPKITRKVGIGIIPHIVDRETARELFKSESEVKIIDLETNNPENTTKKILKCTGIISSSLHGIIVAHAYGIPAVWVKFSDKLYGDDVKFEDYFLSVGLTKPCLPEITSQPPDFKDYIHNFGTLPDQKNLESLRDDLINSFPKKNFG